MLEVSYSRIKRWRSCQQAHYYQYILGIEPRMKAKPLKVGSYLHDLLEAHARGDDWRDVHELIVEEFSGLFVEERLYYGEHLPDDLYTLMEGYEKFHEGDNLTYHEIEEPIGPIPLTSKTSLKGRPDGLVETEDGLLWLLERKSGKKLPDETTRLWDLQTIIYVWAYWREGVEVDGVLWDYIRSKPPAVPDVLKSGQLSRRKNIDTTPDVYLRAIYESGLDPEEYQDMLELLEGRESAFYRRVKLPVQESMVAPLLRDAQQTSLEILYLQETPTRNMSGFTCRGCHYQPLCSADVRGLDTEFIIDNEFQPRKGDNYGQEEDQEEENDN